MLNVGREAGVINEALFTIMVMVALATTCTTTPCVYLIYPADKRRTEKLDLSLGASRRSPSSLGDGGEASSSSKTFGLLTVVDRMEEVPLLTTLMYVRSQQCLEVMGPCHQEAGYLRGSAHVVHAVLPDGLA